VPLRRCSAAAQRLSATYQSMPLIILDEQLRRRRKSVYARAMATPADSMANSKLVRKLASSGDQGILCRGPIFTRTPRTIRFTDEPPGSISGSMRSSPLAGRAYEGLVNKRTARNTAVAKRLDRVDRCTSRQLPPYTLPRRDHLTRVGALNDPALVYSVRAPSSAFPPADPILLSRRGRAARAICRSSDAVSVGWLLTDVVNDESHPQSNPDHVRTLALSQ